MSSTDDFERAFDANPQPCLVFDRDTLQILCVNRAACELYGWTDAELRGMTLRDIRLPEDVPRMEAARADMRADRRPLSFDGRHRAKDGRLFDITAKLGRFEFRGHDAAIVVITDLTGQAERERHARLLVEHSTEGVSIVGADGRLVYVSPGGERMLGVAPGTLIGSDPMQLAHPEDRPGVEHVPPGETRVQILRTRHADGFYRWIEATATNLTLDPGVRGFVTNFRDITARHDAEESLRRSEANFRVLAERSPTLMFVHRDGHVVYMNPALIRALGYERLDQLVGMPVLDLVHPDDVASVRTRIAHTAAHGGGAPGDARMRRRDGTYIVTEGEGIVLDFDGKPSHVVVGNDATARRELFARIALADRLLSVGTLAAGVAHEINNPLAYVSANLELLARELPRMLDGEPSLLSRSQLAEVVSDSSEGVGRVAEIVRELRTLSRNDDVVGAVDIASVLASCIKIAHNELRHRARVVADIATPLPAVAGTTSRVGQVFLNLLVNAAHAIPEGHVDDNEIRVRASVAGDGRQIAVEVSDTGVGMEPAVLDRIFDPFFTTKPVGLGTGLGLSISHGIVRSLGGTITVDSMVGKGSTFRVTLPVANAVAQSAEAGVAREPANAAHVLVIDDEQAVGRSIALLLAPDYDVTTLTRAREALDRIAGGMRYDAIVCDVMMPEMTGIDFYEQLDAIDPDARRRLLFLTGGAFTEQARDFLDATAVPQLEKPFSERDLRRALAALRDRA